MEENEEKLFIDSDSMAKMLESNWCECKKKLKLHFDDSNRDAESIMREVYGHGFLSAWKVMAELSSGLKELDELMNNQN